MKDDMSLQIENKLGATDPSKIARYNKRDRLVWRN
jgi:hypothetical protein